LPSLFRQNTWLVDCIWLTLLIGVVYIIGLGIPPLYFPDEGRYAEIGREMLLLHHWITPHLNSLPYFEKPPLSYWFIASFEWLFGFSEWAVRLTNVFFGLLTCLSVYLTGRLCFNRGTGIWAALILSSSLLFFTMSHLLTTDACLTTTLTLALCGFLIWHRTGSLTALYIAYAAAGFAVLAKGLIGLVFPGATIFLWILFTRQWSVLKRMHLITGLILLAIVAVPWHILAQQQNPTFYHEYFYVNQFLRFTTPVMHREMNKFEYLGVLIGGFMPWMVVLIYKIKSIWQSLRNPKDHPLASFFLLWTLVIVIFFGFSNSILAPYLLPVMPALALLTAPFINGAWVKNRKKIRQALLCTLLISWMVLVLAWILSPLYIHKSTKTLAQVTNTLLRTHPNAELVNYGYYYQDFPFYTRHFVKIVNWRDELNYGQTVDPKNRVLISDADFWHTVDSKQVLYIVISKVDFDNIPKYHANQLFPLAKSTKYLLVTNWIGIVE